MEILKIVRLGVFFMAAALVSIFCGCGKKDAAITKKKSVYEVEVARPLKMPLEVWDKYTARIEGVKSVEIRARVSGYLQKICFEDGDHVSEGDLLFEIDSRPFEIAAEAARAAVEEIESQLELAQSNWDRAQDLIKTRAISRELLETRASALKSAQAKLLTAKANLKQAELDLEFTKIRAPISGYVGKRLVDEGNLVTQSSTLLCDLVSRDTVYAYFEISERDIIRYVKRGMLDGNGRVAESRIPVRASLMDESEPSAFGFLSYVDNKLDSASMELRADIANGSNRLFPGMFADVEIRVSDPVDRLVLPEYAISTDLAGRYVLVVDSDNVVRYRAVSVGELVDNMRIIEEGLKEDDRVVVNGIQRAVVDTKVTPREKDLK